MSETAERSPVVPELPLERLRQALLEQREMQAARLATVDGRALMPQYVDDGGVALADRIAGIRRLLDETEAALRRMDEGTYGVCESCSQPISPVRLEILPHARYCVACQRSRDRQQQTSR